MAKEYDIARAGGACSQCGCELAAGQEFVAVLFDEGQSFRRQDFCPGCWDARGQGRPRAFSVWHGRKAPPQQPRSRQIVSDDLLLEFFDRLAEQTEPAKVNFRFVLALMLMRKKVLIYDRSVLDDGRDIWVMHVKGGSELRVIHPVLNEQQLSEVSDQLSAILEEPT